MLLTLFLLMPARKALKVSKSQNKFMMSSFLSKYERNILRISAKYGDYEYATIDSVEHKTLARFVLV